MFIFSPKILVTERETKGISLLVSIGHPLFLHHFHVRTQTISRPSKSMHASDTFTRDDHRISSESTIRSLDFRICSLRSPHTFCGANQPVVGWLGGQWFPEPTRVKVLVLAFILG